MKIRNCLYHYLEQFMQNRCSSRLERVRLGVFIVSSVLFTLIVSLHILGTIGLDCLWLYVLSWVWIAVSVSSVSIKAALADPRPHLSDRFPSGDTIFARHRSS